MKAYSNKSNARRAARTLLGQEAQEGTHYRLDPVEGGFAIVALQGQAATADEGDDPTAHELSPLEQALEDQAKAMRDLGHTDITADDISRHYQTWRSGGGQEDAIYSFSAAAFAACPEIYGTRQEPAAPAANDDDAAFEPPAFLKRQAEVRAGVEEILGGGAETAPAQAKGGKGITYFATDKHGNVVNRYSAGHNEPRYTYAVIRHYSNAPGAAPDKADVAYCARRDLADAQAKPYSFTVKGETVTRSSEVVAVRAYQGRHAVEPGAPTAEGAEAAPVAAEAKPRRQRARQAQDGAGEAAATPRGEKGKRLLEMLSREGGATVDEIAAELGWLAHTTRARIAVDVKGKGHNLTTEKVERDGKKVTLYKVTPPAKAGEQAA